ncbi:MAG: hypothetical protein RMM98_07990 [Acidobacteriota bacterium]|nr:hypothetical protein [Blastocatellia bacterium]MDW8239540.1 hypothetical protein [Acidobacteriota bacterium]
MPDITRTVKGGVDEDNDVQDEIIFSVVPEEKQLFQHPGEAKYAVQVENNWSESIQVLRWRADVQGEGEYELLPGSIEPGARITMDHIIVRHGGDPHPRVPILEVEKVVKYRVAISELRYPVELRVKADCQSRGQ